MKRALLLHSFAIIQPCNVDRFNGAEFVCCPSDVPAVDNLETESRGQCMVYNTNNNNNNNQIYLTSATPHTELKNKI